MGRAGREIARAHSQVRLRGPVLALRHRVLRLPAAQRPPLGRAVALRRRQRSSPSAQPLRPAVLAHAGQGAKERRLDRIKGVLAAWEKPATTIEKSRRTTMPRLIETAEQRPGQRPSKAVVRRVPATRADASGDRAAGELGMDDRRSARSTRSSASATPASRTTAAVPTSASQPVRQRLIGPQPYLIDPNDYFDVICCLVEKRYARRRTRWARRKSSWPRSSDRIKAPQGAGSSRTDLKKLREGRQGRHPERVDCCDFEKDDDSDSTAVLAR